VLPIRWVCFTNYIMYRYTVRWIGTVATFLQILSYGVFGQIGAFRNAISCEPPDKKLLKIYSNISPCKNGEHWFLLKPVNRSRIFWYISSIHSHPFVPRAAVMALNSAKKERVQPPLQIRPTWYNLMSQALEQFQTWLSAVAQHP
jgi:hypothetical protein